MSNHETRIDPFDTPRSDDFLRESESNGSESVESEQAGETRETVRKTLKSGTGGRALEKSDRISDKIGERVSAKPERGPSSRFIDLYDLNGTTEEK